MVKPKLNPPCPGWRCDLPDPNETVRESPALLSMSPVHIDKVYMEISRNTLSIRGLLIWFAVLVAIWLVRSVCVAVFNLFDVQEFKISVDRVAVTIILWGTMAVAAWASAVFYRMDASPPRDLPLRFNRLRRKVYVYGFYSVWWNPFTRWHVTTASYDWDDLRAEKWKVRGATAGGALILKEGVSIAVVSPGTNNVITRFDFSTTAANTTNLWAYICSYMQNGIEGLDPDHAEPRDLNDVAPYNLALRLAPKVEWPADMDRESRTAP
ncbi:DUF6708 domain-containing protein [Burkholderia sp. Ac-20384]|uniref:DUF6708 domain-containing protein n=1 Tax=Burkholderia sp. Ac-20384 TaxID=2703902 RepID=UPI001F11EBCA|nr:DUF6708 domain-containing protein [Burkholderia sp. Ac-20384]